jgi:chromatin remodeling complex protein RSC6
MVFCFAAKIAAMANKTISMEIVKQIRLLSNFGLGKKTIDRQLSIYKSTVKEYLSKEEPSPSDKKEDAGKQERLFEYKEFKKSTGSIMFC